MKTLCKVGGMAIGMILFLRVVGLELHDLTVGQSLLLFVGAELYAFFSNVGGGFDRFLVSKREYDAAHRSWKDRKAGL